MGYRMKQVIIQPLIALAILALIFGSIGLNFICLQLFGLWGVAVSVMTQMVAVGAVLGWLEDRDASHE